MRCPWCRLLLLAIVLSLESAVVACRPVPPSGPEEFVVAVVVASDDGRCWAEAFSSDDLEVDRPLREIRRVVREREDVGSVLRGSAEAGAEVVVCLGKGCGPAVVAEALRHRDTRFVVVPPVRSSPNLVGAELRGAGAGYLAGVAAARFADPRTPIGLAGEATDRWFEQVARGFETGVRIANRGRTRILRSTDASELSAAGVRVALMSPKVAAEFRQTTDSASVAVILSEGKDAALDHNGVVGFVCTDRSAVVLRAIHLAMDGSGGGEPQIFGLETGLVDLRLSAEVAQFADSEFQQRMSEAREAVLSGVVAVENYGL